MFIVFHADAYFSLGGEVLLQFMVRVEVTEIINLIWIQIGSEFRKDLKIKKLFPDFHWPWVEFLPTGPTVPAAASLMCGPCCSPARPSSTSTRHALARPTPSVLLMTTKPSPSSSSKRRRGNLPYLYCLTEMISNPKGKNAWGLTTHLSRPLEWKPL
jgi:hypothetical protein